METPLPVRIAPLEFARDGFVLKQIWREGPLAIYSQRRPWKTDPDAFEVVRLKVAKAHPKDIDQSPKEHYPNANEWGVRGWTCLSASEAHERVAKLLAK